MMIFILLQISYVRAIVITMILSAKIVRCVVTFFLICSAETVANNVNNNKVYEGQRSMRTVTLIRLQQKKNCNTFEHFITSYNPVTPVAVTLESNLWNPAAALVYGILHRWKP